MARTLILYASHYGQTRAIAARLADRLREHGHDVELVDARAERRALPAPGPYGAVLLGSRVEGGRHAAEIEGYIHLHRAALADRVTAFFSVSMAAARPDAGPDPSGYLDALFTATAWRPTRAVAFAGALPYRRYGLLMRLLMKRVARSAGHSTDTSRDHELTDWARVARFADAVAAIIPPAARLASEG